MANEFIQQLLAKRKLLAEQTAAVNALLKAEGYADTDGLPAWKPASPITKAEAIKRALTKAGGKPLTTKELVKAMEAENYVFNTDNAPNALNNLLYGRKKLPFICRDPSNAGFILAAGSAAGKK